MDRKEEIANTLNAISRGWVEGYTRNEIDALKTEHASLLLPESNGRCPICGSKNCQRPDCGSRYS